MSTENSAQADIRAIDRLEQAREALQMDMAAFCRKSGLRYASYHASVQRRSSLTEDVLRAVSIHTSVSTRWLLTGEAPMLRAAGALMDLDGLRDEYELRIAQFERTAKEHTATIHRLEKQLDAAQATAKMLAAAAQHQQVQQVGESKAASYHVDRIRQLETELQECRERLKKLGRDEKATQVKEGG